MPTKTKFRPYHVSEVALDNFDELKAMSDAQLAEWRAANGRDEHGKPRTQEDES